MALAETHHWAAGGLIERDYTGAEGALRLKQTIEEYWAERGQRVCITLHHAGFIATMRSARTDIRSDMKNGWPRLRALPSPEQDR